MSTMISEALALEGLWLLVLGVTLAGLVRGFSGFGTALVYLPLAAQVIDPVWVLLSLVMFDIIGPIPAIPRTWRATHRRDLMRLCLGALVVMPIGVFVLARVSGGEFRWVVSLVSLAMLVVLISGFRWTRPVAPGFVWATGGAGGFLCGSIGLPGPPVILFYMARALSPEAIRANIFLYLWATDIMLLAHLWLQGLVVSEPVILGALLIPVYFAAVMLGTWSFDPRRETVYRWVAYAIIAGSALSGLPVWG